MTEFVIVLPILCVLLFGMIQFGIAWNNYVTLTDAVRAGARKAAVSRRADPVGSGCTRVREAAPSLAGKGLECGGSISGSIDLPGAAVTIRATHPYSIKLLGISVASGRLESVTTERLE